jgi:hypothetical protein
MFGRGTRSRRPSTPVSAAVFAAVIASVVSTCARGPEAPSAPSAPTSGSATGTVVRVLEQAPIAAATVRIDELVCTTDANGHFTVAGLPASLPLSLSVTADGYLNRQSHYRVGGTGEGSVVDLIPDSSPFLLDFFRQFARNAAEGAVLEPLNPWTSNPSFYFKTTQSPSGETIPAEVLQHIETIFANSVRELSGGRLAIAEIEKGPEARPLVQGWVNVLFQSELPHPGAAGSATVGGNKGTIWLKYDPATPQVYTNDPSGCYSRVVQVAAHEIFHTMGYYHVSTAYDGFLQDPACDGTGLSDAVRYHAAVMYSRPPGNMDPDTDPASVVFGASAARELHVISCSVPPHR